MKLMDFVIQWIISISFCCFDLMFINTDQNTTEREIDREIERETQRRKRKCWKSLKVQHVKANHFIELLPLPWYLIYSVSDFIIWVFRSSFSCNYFLLTHPIYFCIHLLLIYHFDPDSKEMWKHLTILNFYSKTTTTTTSQKTREFWSQISKRKL